MLGGTARETGTEGDGVGVPGWGMLGLAQPANRQSVEMKLVVLRCIVSVWSLIVTALSGKQTTPDQSWRRLFVVGKRSISRVLSDYSRNPDDHFSTSMVAHAL